MLGSPTTRQIVLYPDAQLSSLDAGTWVAYPRGEGVGAHRYYAVPSFLVIGAQRCGTGELNTWLGAHPCVRGLSKEWHFFDRTPDLDRDWARYVLSRDFLVSEDLASAPASGVQTFETTPSYLDGLNGTEPVPALVRRMMPGGRFIVLLRDPVERIYSAYRMFLRMAARRGTHPHVDPEDPSFRTFVAQRTSGQHLDRPIIAGHYVEHLETWLRFFRREQLLILVLEEFQRDPFAVLARVQDFLGLPRFDYRSLAIRSGRGLWVLEGRPSKAHRQPDPPMDARDRDALSRYYAPWNVRLRAAFPELRAPW